MSALHLFEFMDQDWVPSSLRATLREILECGNASPFRGYYRWVADEVHRAAAEHGATTIVELGAGTAPVTRLLAKTWPEDGIPCVVCDYNPDVAAYRELEHQYPGKVRPCYQPVDFSQPQQWPPGSLIFLSATLHHVPSAERGRVIEALTNSADRVMVFEPLRKSMLSILFVLPSLIPALLLPLWFFHRPGKLKRFVWCWLLPAAPLMFWWDGLISCLRQWTSEQWKLKGPDSPGPQVLNSCFCQMVTWG